MRVTLRSLAGRGAGDLLASAAVLQVDLAAAPFVLHRWIGRPDDDDIALLRDVLRWEVARRESLFVFCDLRAGVLPEPARLRALGSLFREFAPQRRRALFVGILDSWAMQSALNALRFLVPSAGPELFARSGRAALMAAAPPLRTLGAPDPAASFVAALLANDAPLSARQRASA
jgi:hypothetical protein